MSIQFDVIEQFSTRPTLRSVASGLLRETLNEDFPALTLDPDAAAVCHGAPNRQRIFTTLTDAALVAFSKQVTPSLNDEGSTLIADIQSTNAAPLTVSMRQLDVALDTVSRALLDGFSQALADFWFAPDRQGVRRWKWLADSLRQQLLVALDAGEYAALTDEQRTALRTVATFSNKGHRDLLLGLPGSTRRLRVQMVQKQAHDATPSGNSPITALVLNGEIDGQALNLLYRPSGEVVSYATQHALLEALGSSAADADADADVGVDAVAWRLFEPGSDCFEWLAQVMLEQQLAAVAALKGAERYVLADVEHALASATDISTLILRKSATTRDLALADLPDWLRTAPVVDHLAYSRGLSALAIAQHRADGKAYSDDLPSIMTYAVDALGKQMLIDHPLAGDLSAGDIELQIHKTIAAALPSAGQVFSVGSVETRRMSLLAYTLENLAGKPGTPMSIHRPSGLPVPDWLTAQYLNGLVTAVDVGANYPALLRSKLIDDKAEASRREKLFSDQLAVQLPLKALEQRIKAEGAMTQAGVECVSSLMQPAGERDGVVLRQLGFVAKAGAKPDWVGTMFVIGNHDTGKGPFVLYRPFSRVALTQFASWSALREAIVEAGDLQIEVLDWLSAHARAVYGNGGFSEPHIVRVGQGSEFAPIETPLPATLAVQVVEGEPLSALFTLNAQALVSLADRNSVSNAESRWANLKEGGWLLLNALLPFVAGALGNVVWLNQLLASTENLIKEPGVSQSQPSAWADLLLNIALVLMHQNLAAGLAAPRLARVGAEVSSVSAPLAGGLTHVDHSSVPPFQHTTLDFSWTSPSSRLTTGQHAAMEALKITTLPELGQARTEGEHQGLYEQEGHWYVRIDADCYRVSLENDRVRIIGESEGQEKGPFLLRGPTGWQVDLSLKLLGGSPRKTARKLAVSNAELVIRVIKQRAELNKRADELAQRVKGYNTQLQTATGELREQFLNRFETELEEMVEIVHKNLALSNELRVQDRPPERVNASALKAAARRICYFEATLLGDLLKVAREEVRDLQRISPDLVIPENVDAYQALYKKMLLMQVKGRHWAGVRELLWKELRAVPKIGEDYWRTEVLEMHKLHLFTEFEWHVTQLWSLLELSFGPEEMVKSVDAIPLKTLRNEDNLHLAFTSHAELDKPNDYSLSQQISVLESSLDEYSRAIDVILAVQDSGATGINRKILNEFLTELGDIADAAEARLSGLIRESSKPPEGATVWVPTMSQPRHRVIRTHNQRTLVGRVREGEPDLHGEVVDVTDPMTSRVIGTYHKHGDGDWVEVVEPPPPFSPVASTGLIPLGALKSSARTLLAEVESAISNAKRQSLTAYAPEDLQDILQQRADKLSALADKLGAHSAGEPLTDGIAEELATLLGELRAGAERLSDEGRSLRISMIKAQPPTAARVSYLERQREVNIASFGPRKNLSGARRDDFMQEYVVRDTEGKALWWAHFHYTSQDAAADAFTAAHLKTPEQRLLRYQEVLDAAKSNKQVVSVYRSVISKDIAQRLFLTLAPQAVATD